MIDARPFRTLKTTGGQMRCSAPKVNPLSLGLSGGGGRVAADSATHTTDAYVVFGTPPADLRDNARVLIDVEPGIWSAFRILRNGIDKGPGTWRLYLRAEDNAGGYVP